MILDNGSEEAMSDIGARLLASLRYDAVNGTPGERAVVTQQMREAAQYIATLTVERNVLRKTVETEVERLQGIMKAKDAMLAIYNDEERCHVEFDTEATIKAFCATQDDLAAAEAAKEK